MLEKRLRILIVTLEYPPSSIGGYGVMCAQVCEWLHQQGHDLFVLTVEPLAVHAAEERFSQPGLIPVRRTLRSYWDGSECLYPPLLDALALEQENQRQFRQTVTEYRPDVVSFWHMGDMSLGLITITARLGLPMVFVIGDDWLCYGWWADGWTWRFRVVEEKGIEVAINAMRYLPQEATLLVVGPVKPAYRSRLEEIAGAIGVAERLSFALGSRHDMRSYYQISDVTLFTSMIEHKAFGLVPLEAMAGGCPVISMCVGGSAEYCSDSVTCLAVLPGDAHSLALAVQRLATHPDLRHQLSAGGLRMAGELTLERQARRIEHWLLTAADKSM